VDSPLLSSLHLKLGERVISLSRLRLGNGQPLVIALIYLPEHLFPHFLERDLNSRSVYEIMDAYGLKPTEAAQTFQAVALAKEEAKLFGVSPGLPELLIVRTGYAGAVPVEYAVDYYRGDRTKFRIALTDVSVRRELHFHME
jgi:GntR family transcriptional regulator